MKTALVVMGSFVLTLGTALGQVPAATPPPAKTGAATKATAPKKKEEPPPKIEGTEVARGANGFLGVQVVDGRFKISFYDAQKKPKAPDVTRAALRWDAKHKTGQERAMLTTGGGPNSLASDKYVRPPYNFKLFVTLLKDGAEEGTPGETLVIDFRQ